MIGIRTSIRCGRWTYRFFSSTIPPTPKAPLPSASRIEQIAAKLPKSLRPYAARFADSPVSHITSFLVLHELSAVIPLGAVWWLIHITQWKPPGLPDKWILKGYEFWDNYFKKKDWETFKGGQGARLLMEIGTAYAVVKAALPLRIGLSLWATPWFARMFVVPVARLIRWKKA